MRDNGSPPVRIAVAEDEPDVRKTFVRLLECLGHKVVCSVGNGEELIDQCKLDDVDIAFVDLDMPVVDGLVASQRILAQLPVCIVLSTASYSDEYAEQARNLGCDFLKKPILIDTFGAKLVAAYQRFLKEHRPSTSQAAA